ncbi:MAG: hypothetical protein H0T43_12780 [Solirubrobacterales bacterium]|nr:hypothetical protein [Solirubrobacterales bacterium]
MDRLTPRLLLVLLCALLCAVLVAACGEDEESAAARAPSTVDRLLAQTFGDGPGATKSGRLNAGLRFAGEGLRGLDGPVTVKLTGPFSGDGEGLPNFDFSLKGDIAGAPVDAGAVSTGEKGYLKLRGKVYELGDMLFGQFKRGFEGSRDEEGKGSKKRPTFASLGIDPRRWLTGARIAGTEVIGGAETIRITGGVDAGRLLADVNRLLGKSGAIGVPGLGGSPSKISPESRRVIAGAVRRAKVDIWTGKADRNLRRLAVDVAFAVPAAARDSVGGLRKGTLKLDLLIAELNEDQQISAPKGVRPLTELLGPGLGALLGGTGAPRGSAAQGAGSAYLECLRKAGDRTADIKACVTELTR